MYPALVTLRQIVAGGLGSGGRGGRQQECCRQAYREVFTASPARRYPGRDSAILAILVISGRGLDTQGPRSPRCG